MTLFGMQDRSAEEATAFYQRFLAAGPPRLAWFCDEVERVAGRRPAPVVEDLAWLVPGVVDNLGVEGPADAPEWFTDAFRAEGWTAYGAALADGLVHLVAEIYRRRLGATWQLCLDPDHAHHLRPVMSLGGVTPPWRIVGTLVGIRQGRQPVDRVRASVSYVIDTTGAERADVGVPVLEVTASAIDHPRFDRELFIDEAAESLLGTEVYDSLADRFAAIDGVAEVVQEDRDMFLLRAPTVDVGTLQLRAQAVVADALGGRPG